MGRNKRPGRSKSSGNLLVKDTQNTEVSLEVFKRTQYSNGDIHEGYRDCDGNMVSWGSYVWKNGDRYVGQWHNNNMWGNGCFQWAMGDVYEGQWVAGESDGYGMKTMCDGSIIKGTFRRGEAHGWASKLFSCGDTYSGIFLHDRKDGYGSYSWGGGKELYRG